MEGTRAQVTAVPVIDGDVCRSCARCLARGVCRSKAIIQIDPGEPPVIDSSRCYGCQVCVAACPHGAITAQDRG